MKTLEINAEDLLMLKSLVNDRRVFWLETCRPCAMSEFHVKEYERLLALLESDGKDWVKLTPCSLIEQNAADLVARLNAHEAMSQGWINCIEQMPPRGEFVLVYVASSNWVTMGRIYSRVWQSNFGARLCNENDVTHWRPLPEPPK